MNENAENENRSSETTVSLKRSSSILKTGEIDQKTMMYGDETMASEMTSKTKKLRRVSFSARIQVKTIDESLSDPHHGNGENQKPSEGAKSSKPAGESALTDISNQVNTTVNPNPLVSDDSHLKRTQQLLRMDPAEMSLLSSPANMNKTDMLCQSMDLGNNTTYHCMPDEGSILGNMTMGGCVTMNASTAESLMIEQESSIDALGISSDDPLHQTRTNITATMMTMTIAQTKKLKIAKANEEDNSQMDTDSTQEIRLEVPALPVAKMNETITLPEPSFVDSSRIVLQEKNDIAQAVQHSNSVLEISSLTKTKNMTYEMSLMNNVTTSKTTEKSASLFASSNETMDDLRPPSNLTITMSQEKSVVCEQVMSNKTYDVSVAEISRRSQAACETYVIDNATKIMEASAVDAPNATKVISSGPSLSNNTYSVRPDQSANENSVFSKPIDMSDSILLVGGSDNSAEKFSQQAAPRGIQHETIVIDNTRMKSTSPSKTNATMTIQGSAQYQMSSDECFNMSNITSSNLSRLLDNFNSSAMMPPNSHMNHILSSTAAVNSHYPQLNTTTDLANATFENASVIELAKPQPKSEIQTKIHNEYKALKELLTNKVGQLREQKKKSSEALKKQLEENNLEKLQEELRQARLSKERAEERLAEKRNEINKLRMKVLNDSDRVRAFIFQDSALEKAKSELKGYLVKNQSIENEYKETMVQYEKLKERIESNSAKIKALQDDQNEKERFKNLCQQLFNDSELPFKITGFENDTIKLSFFYDLIHLDIKVSNIINDISAQQQANIRDLNQQQRKYLNYPIQQLFFRSSVDKNGVLTDASSALKKVIGSRVPPYLRFCVDLVLGEIGEGDLMNLKKIKPYKYVKDLPMLITHIKLACRCAINLAKDFEHFGVKAVDTGIKCDFDSANHQLTLELPSVEDACYFRLKLKVLPGAYYQQPIDFTIEPMEETYFLPNISRLSNLFNNQYFEEGSLRSYLKKLNQF